MDKEFSQGFQKDMADLLEICMNNKTDNITIDMEYPSGILEIDMTFKVHKVHDDAPDSAAYLAQKHFAKK